MKHFETDLSPKVANINRCGLCDYNTCKLSDLKKHLQTVKHMNRANVTEMKHNVSKNLQCMCGIVFNNRTTLWRHKKKCNYEVENINGPEKSLCDKDLIMVLVKQNSELMEMLKNGTCNTNSNNTNCNNKTFNLNVFLNETCKNAMNMSEFVDSIQVQLKDLERFGEVGYVEGISNIITSSLKEMDVTVRPVHCTDQKRETIYIKDDNKWEKEDENKTKLKKLIKRVEVKNHKLLPAYREKYPGCQSADSKFSDKYNKMMVEVMGGSGNNDVEKIDKIVHIISKNVVVNK